MRIRLACTVGTSLLNNIRAFHRSDLGLNAEDHQSLKDALEQNNPTELAKRLAGLDPSAKVCGAEINSIYDAIQRGRLDLHHLHFLVSDTEEGRWMGQLLEAYFIERGLPSLQTVNWIQIDDLKDDQPKRFKIYGLRNLVRELGNLVRQYSADTLTIDATGGYKAQIAIAVVFGQVLQIPVLYRHERFSEIIDFPPMPIGFDYALLGENAQLLAIFESGAALTRKEFDELDERVRVLLEEIEVDGENLFALGPVGQIFLDGFRLRFPRDRELAPVTDKEPPTFRDDHYPIGFREFVKKLCEDIPWIKTAHSLPYDKQKSIKGNGAYVREGQLIGTYVDKDSFGARFKILTNASGEDQLTWAADQINRYLRE